MPAASPVTTYLNDLLAIVYLLSLLRRQRPQGSLPKSLSKQRRVQLASENTQRCRREAAAARWVASLPALVGLLSNAVFCLEWLERAAVLVVRCGGRQGGR
jgi:hypothetical protein